MAPQLRYRSDGGLVWASSREVESARSTWAPDGLGKLESSNTFKVERQWILDTIVVTTLNRSSDSKSCRKVSLIAVTPLPNMPRKVPDQTDSERKYVPSLYNEDWIIEACGVRSVWSVFDHHAEVQLQWAAPTCKASQRSTPQIRAVWHGWFRNDLTAKGGNVSNNMSDRISEEDETLPRLQTDRAVARSNTALGVAFKIMDSSCLTTVPYEAVWTFPRSITHPRTGVTRTEHKSGGTCPTNGTCRELWRFDNSWERVPGEWTVQVFIDGSPALTRSFFVSVD